MNIKLSAPNEVTLSQLPAMRVLHNLGWQYLSKAQVREQRDGSSSFILQDVFKERTAKINDSSFSDRDIITAMNELRPSSSDLLAGNIDVYKLLIGGTNIDKSDDEKIKGFKPFKYIDWDNLDNNYFHFNCEFDASQGHEHKRLDIVLFVNGIPMVAIECKAPTKVLEQATAQIENYQRCLPRLFSFVQLVVSINAGEKAQYAAMGGKSNYWAGWREASEENLGFSKEYISSILDAEVPLDVLQSMDKDLNQSTGVSQGTNKVGGVDNPQNQLLISLFNRERFIDLVRNFTIVGENSKKVALAHQYFVVKNGLIRIAEKDNQDKSNTRRKGGVIWHTQGSGKSNVMIFFIKNLQRHLGAEDPRVILVSDRLELNDQMVNNLNASNIDYKLAKSGEDLRELIIDKSAPVILTNVHKFSNAAADAETKESFVNESHNIFLLVDECHRTEYGKYAKAMRRILPHGCYIGFTGTPLLKDHKNDTFRTFGQFIEPTYPIKSALDDDTVVPLLYEPRSIKVSIDDDQIDIDIPEATKELSDYDATKLKLRFSQATTIKQLETLIGDMAKDIAQHYLSYVASYPVEAKEIKAQLVVPNKAQAVLYHQALAKNNVTSKVVISPPGQDNEEDPDNITKKEANDIVEKFWEKEVIRGGQSHRNYEREVIKSFKGKDDPQILVVVDKLITGFDAPNNTILYLCKSLRDHTLLQAIARVNRLNPGKKNGLIVDYTMTFGNIKDALIKYAKLKEYSPDDLEDTLQSVSILIGRFDRVYDKIKKHLDLSNGANSDGMWDALLATIVSDGSADEFCNDYRNFMELYAQLASVWAFHDKYGKQFDEIHQHIAWGATLYKYLVGLNDPQSKDLLVASELIKYSLNNNVTANGFVATEEPIDIDNIMPPADDNLEVRDPAEEYKVDDDETKSKGGLSRKKKYFQEYIEKINDMKREVENMSDSHPYFAGKMSELIKEELARVDQMLLNYDKDKLIDELNNKSKKALNTTFKELQKYMEKKSVGNELPSYLNDLPDALEYYHVVGNMLKKERIDIQPLEEALCALAKNTYEILEGEDRRGWCDDIDEENKILFEVEDEIWKLEDGDNNFPKELDGLAADMLDIGRARQTL